MRNRERNRPASTTSQWEIKKRERERGERERESERERATFIRFDALMLLIGVSNEMQCLQPLQVIVLAPIDCTSQSHFPLL